MQQEAYPSPATLRRFWAKVDKDGPGGCWLWTAATSVGYGVFYIGMKPGRRTILEGAHRVSYKWFVGPIPEGLHVCHKCDVRACVNPEHFFLGTAADNMKDAQTKGRLNGADTPMRGERASTALLSDDEALALRADHRAGMRNRDIAAKYGIAEQHAWAICFRRPWMDAIDGVLPRRYRPRRKAA